MQMIMLNPYNEKLQDYANDHNKCRIPPTKNMKTAKNYKIMEMRMSECTHRKSREQQKPRQNKYMRMSNSYNGKHEKTKKTTRLCK